VAAQVVPSRRVRAFERSRRWVQQIHAACDAVQQGVWLGILDADGLQHLTEHHYYTTGNYFSESHNEKGFFAWEKDAVDTHFARCRTVLLGAAGGGREALELSRRGVTVDAFECNPDLVESCRSFLAAHGVDAKVIVAPPNEVPESLAAYDGGILGWSSYMHIVGRDRRIEFLKGFHRHLRPSAPLLVSFLPYRHSPARAVTYAVATVLRRLRFAAPIERGDSLTATFEHRFTRDEIQHELASAGFELVSFTERRYGYAVGRALSK
jgi:hypothetical protein